MTCRVYCALEFEKAFDEWVHNHFCEPDYRKELAMKKPGLKHIGAITRTQHIMETGIDVSNKPELAKSIKKDIDLLCEVRDILYKIIENPTLPFVEAYNDPKEPMLNPIEDEPNEAD